MYLWNAERLALALRAERLTETDKAKYLMVGALLAGLSPQAGLIGLRNITDAVQVGGGLAVTLGGIWICFRANQRGDGRAFIERFYCLFVPVYVRWLALYYAAWITLALVGEAVGRHGLPATAFGQWYSLLMLPLLYALLYQYVALAAQPAES
jgi:hypothetical protein